MKKNKNNYISLINRKKISGRNSIEGIFSMLIKHIDNAVMKEVPAEKADFQSILRNLFFVFTNRSRVTHITGDAHYLVFAAGKHVVLTIHDTASILKGGILKKNVSKIFWFWLPCLFASKITVVSNFSKSELSKAVPFVENKLIVIHNPYNENILFSEKKFDSKNPKILHIGAKENKNLDRVIKALAGIKCHLLIVGEIKGDILSLLKKYDICYSSKSNISFQEVVDLYNECDMVSFPSLYEGFGMPIIEANKAGRPIITSNICSMPEVANDAACFVNPYSISSIKAGFEKVINDEEYRKKIINNGFENVKRFDPKKIASQYNDVYLSVLNHEK